MATRFGVASLSSSNTSVAVAFSTAMPDANYIVQTEIAAAASTVGPAIVPPLVTAKTSAGFTLQFAAAPTPGSLTIRWLAQSMPSSDGTSPLQTQTAAAGTPIATDFASATTTAAITTAQTTADAARALQSTATKTVFATDFLNALNGAPLTSTVSGTGAAVASATGCATNAGIVGITTGTTTTGAAGIMTAADAILFGGAAYTLRGHVNISAASDGTNTFVVRAGFLDSISAEPTDGVYLRYTHSVNSGKWVVVTRANGTETVTNVDQAIVTAADTYQLFSITVSAAADSVSGTIGATAFGPIATNIPSGAGRHTGVGASIIKSAGTTARILALDTLSLEATYTTTRG